MKNGAFRALPFSVHPVFHSAWWAILTQGILSLGIL